jgi:hypothetical protein
MMIAHHNIGTMCNYTLGCHTHGGAFTGHNPGVVPLHMLMPPMSMAMPSVAITPIIPNCMWSGNRRRTLRPIASHKNDRQFSPGSGLHP